MSRILLKALWGALLSSLGGLIAWCFMTYIPGVSQTTPQATLLVEDEVVQESLAPSPESDTLEETSESEEGVETETPEPLTLMPPSHDDQP